MADSISFSAEYAFGQEIKIHADKVYAISGPPADETYREFFDTKPDLRRDRMPVSELGISGSSMNGMIPFYVEASDEFEVIVRFFNLEEEKIECKRVILIQPGLNYKAFDESALPDNRYMVMIVNKEETSYESLTTEVKSE